MVQAEGTPIQPAYSDQIRNTAEFRRISKSAEKITNDALREVNQVYRSLYDSGQNYAEPINQILRTTKTELDFLAQSMGRQAAENVVKRNDQASKVRTANSVKNINEDLARSTMREGGNVDATKTASYNNVFNLAERMVADYYGQFEEMVNRLISTGADPKIVNQQTKSEKADLNKKLNNRSKLIANDQTRKGFMNETAARMKQSGVKKFKWQHSGAGEPRPHHIAPYPQGLNGGIYEIDNPPIINPDTGERGLPGQEPNCKCIMIPVLDFGDEE